MSKLNFTMNVDASTEKLMELACDYENYSEKSGWFDILNQERHKPENLRDI